MATEPSTTPTQRLADWAAMQRGQSVAARLGALRRRSGIMALIDQGLVSGINFVTAVVVARFLEPTSYGFYTLLFALLLAINGLQTALITGPLMVIAPRHKAEERGAYLNSLWCIQLAGCLLAAIGVVVFKFAAPLWQPQFTVPAGVVPIVLVVTSYLAQEFVRRMLFCERDTTGGFGVDLISYGGQFAAIVALIAFERLTFISVLWAMGLTSLAACLFGVMRMGLSFTGVRRSDVATTWGKHWEYGRWLVSGNLTHWSATQLYAFVVAALLSPAAVGLFAAGRNLLGFTHIFLLGLENFVPATMTRRLLSGGTKELERWTNQFRWFSISLVGAYCLLAAVFAGPLITLLFGEQYQDASLVVPIIAAGYFIVACNRPTMFALRAIGAPRWSFYANLAAAIVTIVVSVPLVKYGGIVGAAVGMLTTNVIVLVVGSVGYRREVHAHDRANDMENHSHG